MLKFLDGQRTRSAATEARPRVARISWNGGLSASSSRSKTKLSRALTASSFFAAGTEGVRAGHMTAAVGSRWSRTVLGREAPLACVEGKRKYVDIFDNIIELIERRRLVAGLARALYGDCVPVFVEN